MTTAKLVASAKAVGMTFRWSATHGCVVLAKIVPHARPPDEDVLEALKAVAAIHKHKLQELYPPPKETPP